MTPRWFSDKLGVYRAASHAFVSHGYCRLIGDDVIVALVGRGKDHRSRLPMATKIKIITTGDFLEVILMDRSWALKLWTSRRIARSPRKFESVS